MVHEMCEGENKNGHDKKDGQTKYGKDKILKGQSMERKKKDKIWTKTFSLEENSQHVNNLGVERDFLQLFWLQSR